MFFSCPCIHPSIRPCVCDQSFLLPKMVSANQIARFFDPRYLFEIEKCSLKFWYFDPTLGKNDLKQVHLAFICSYLISMKFFYFCFWLWFFFDYFFVFVGGWFSSIFSILNLASFKSVSNQSGLCHLYVSISMYMYITIKLIKLQRFLLLEII